MIEIRQLKADEWSAFRAFRLAALQAEPGVFSSTFDAEQALPDADWISPLNSPTCAIFGLFDDEHLVGITAAFTDREDPSGQTAVLAMSFILPDYRRRGLSTLLYDARLAWARARPQFRRVVVGHRASNETSRKANQKHGFRFVRRRPHVWPDGGAEDELLYELPLVE